MSDDLRSNLQRLAPAPRKRPDIARLVAEGTRRRRNRVFYASVGSVLAVLLVTAGLLRASSLLGDSVPRPPEPVASSPSPDGPSVSFPRGWTTLAPPPDARTSSATAWTGGELLVWGGYTYTGYSDETLDRGGFSFDARSGTWNEIPEGPLSPRANPASAWTGEELLVWGGSSIDITGFVGDGAAYDPDTQTWRPLPEAPISARAPLSVWTGEEFIVWGSSVRGPKLLQDGAAYNPSTNEWRPIAPGPLALTDAVAVWSGTEMFVFGAALRGGNKAFTESAVGAAYDPFGDQWRELPATDLSPQASTAAWDGDELVAWDYLHGSAAYDPVTDRWRRVPSPPIDFSECYPNSMAIGAHIFGDFCGQPVLYDSASGRWERIERGDFELGWGFNLVSAGDTALLLGSKVGRSGQTRGLFAYRPPPPPGTSSTRCDYVPERPTYLPWTDEVPAPEKSYDDEIDRAQLWWTDPDSSIEVALTVYPADIGVEEPSGIRLRGIEGSLHRFDESPDVASISWDVPDVRCNFIELTLYGPGLTKSEAVEELKRVASSLRRPVEPSPMCDIQPFELPSGADPGEPRLEEGAFGQVRVWGRGQDKVTLLQRIPASLRFGDDVSRDQRVIIRGVAGMAIPIGEEQISQTAVTWRAEGCEYTMWVEPGLSLDDVRDYAHRF